jgi:hypothetical protein
MSLGGAWKTTVVSSLGPQGGEMTLSVQGDAFTGQMIGRLATQEIAGRIEGDRLTWTCQVVRPFPIRLEFEAVLAGGVLRGHVRSGVFGALPFTAVRA